MKTPEACDIRDPSCTFATTLKGEDRLLITVDYLEGVPRSEARAAVKFFSAMPDLLSAAKEVLAQAEMTAFPLGPDLADSIRVFLRNAIEKAEGKRS